MRKLRHFQIDSGRDVLYPDFRCYQMDLRSLVSSAIKANPDMDKDFSELPSWSKFAAHPLKAKGFFVRMLESLFYGKHGHDELNVDLMMNRFGSDIRVAMMFMPGNITKECLITVGNIAREVLSGYEVVVINGNTTTNRQAEKFVREIVSRNKNVLIISAQMAQRSFSIPEITELYLCYDNGQVGATIQKMSRVLTPGDINKVGHIFSLSFDPNRDDKFDSMITETAFSYKRRHKMTSLKNAMRAVLRTIDIFDCQPNGAVKFNIDSYLDKCLNRNTITRTLGRQIRIDLMDEDVVVALASGNIDYMRNVTNNVANRGKIRVTTRNTAKKNPKKIRDKEQEKARKMVVTILDNIDVLIYGSRCSTIHEALTTIERDPILLTTVENKFEVPFVTIKYLFGSGIISRDWVEILDDEFND